MTIKLQKMGMNSEMKKLLSLVLSLAVVLGVFLSVNVSTTFAESTNLALNKEVTGVGFSFNSYSIVTDGQKTGGKFIADGGLANYNTPQSSSYVTVDLGKLERVSEVKGLLVTDVFHQWLESADVFYSVDNINFVKFGTIKNTSQPKDVVAAIKDVSGSVEARYIKVTNFLKGIGTYTRATINELEIYGDPVAALPAPTGLAAILNNAKVQLSWNAVTGASGYIVKRATNAGGPYDVIVSNVTSATYIDTTVVSDTAYYYVVSAINMGAESPNSNEASITTTEPGRAILTITLTSGLEKEYDLSMSEINSFLSWYEAKATGIGNASFAINKHENNKGPFKNRKDYVIFDKILTFEVSEY